MFQRFTMFFVIGVVLTPCFTSLGVSQDKTFSSYREAMSAGAKLYNAGKLAESRIPFEAAARLAETDADRCRVQQALLVVYAEGKDFDRMYESAEFLIEHATYPAMASLGCRALLGQIHRKGQVEAAQKRYEGKLAKNPKDRTSLYVLAEFHGGLDRDFAKRVEYLKRQLALDKEEGKELDVDKAGKLAFASRLARNYVESAELFEKIAPLNKDEEAWNHKEAASSWLKAKQMDKALAAARKADALGADDRANRSKDRWHSELGEVFLAAKQRDLAVKHYEQALAGSKTDYSKKKYSELLAEAKKL